MRIQEIDFKPRKSILSFYDHVKLFLLDWFSYSLLLAFIILMAIDVCIIVYRVWRLI